MIIKELTEDLKPGETHPLLQYLYIKNDEYNEQDLRRLQAVIELIKKHCSDILKIYQSTGQMLYRGTKTNFGIAYIGTPRTERIPTSSNASINDAFNRAMEKLGYQARRDNSLFCSSSQSHAAGFGSNIYVIFPLNGFDYTWSRAVGDMVLENKDIPLMVDPVTVEYMEDLIFQNPKIYKKFIEIEERIVRTPKTRTNYNKLMTANFWGHDLNIIGHLLTQGILPSKLEPYRYLKNWVDPHMIQKNYKLTSKNLDQALLRPSQEVMIKGKYIAVNTEVDVAHLLNLK